MHVLHVLDLFIIEKYTQKQQNTQLFLSIYLNI